MRIAVLTSPESWYFHDLLRAAPARHQVTAVSFKALWASVQPKAWTAGSGRRVLADYDALIVRSMPPASLEQIVLRMDVLGHLEQRGMPVVNRPRALEIAIDKFLATSRLQAAGLLVPDTSVCQRVEEALDAFHQLGGDVVVKPLFGGEGRGITRISDPAVAGRVFSALVQVHSVLYLQRYVPHEGADFRLLVIGDEVLGMRRSHPTDWRTNVSRGAVGEPLNVTDELASLAQAAARAVGASVAGVDLLPGTDGQLYALEVNGVPGWRTLARVSGIDVAERVLQHVDNLGRHSPSPGGPPDGKINP